MKIPWFKIIVLAFLLSSTASVVPAGVIYFDDFESYDINQSIEGQGAWLDTGSIYKWQVINDFLLPEDHTGNFLVRGEWYSQSFTQDFAVMHLSSANGFGGLRISMDYLLQEFERGKIEISGNQTAWIDVTSRFNLMALYSNSLIRPTSADLTDLVTPSGINNDLYVRFSARNAGYFGEWHWFAIDNIKVETNPASVPDASSTVAMLCISLVSLVALRRKLGKN